MDDKPLTLKLDTEAYLSQLDDWDITEDEKSQLLDALWGVLVSFAEIGFEIHPVQRVLSTGFAEKAGISKHPMIESNPSAHIHDLAREPETTKGDTP